jgi:hypothetical protein
MTAAFYLFDVDHGQSAALRLPNGRWCIFDAGCTDTFSPVEWIAAANPENSIAHAWGLPPGFRFLKGTISHLHGDHLADCANLFEYGPDYFRTVVPDAGYLSDCLETCSDEDGQKMIEGFVKYVSDAFGPAVAIPDYAAAAVQELSLDVDLARAIGGDANARVNNASIMSRIDVYGNAILLCGDLTREALDGLLCLRGPLGDSWRCHVANVDILVAPHHGHKSGYSAALLDLAKPRIVLASVVSKDPHVDSRYSQNPVRGIRVGDTDYRLMTTRKQGHIKVEISPPEGLAIAGARSWAFGDRALRWDLRL